MTALDTLQAALSDRYAIQREIGAGGMATVYLARDLRHQRDVALKVLKPELGAVLGAERFLSEIRVTANLQHPNLLPLFDSGEAGGLLYYVMPFVAGETLRSRIDREKQLPVDEAVRIAVAVASALGYAHEHGVIHRDLKPENILIQAGQPVIADFGIALAVSNAGGARVTQTGLSLGTPQYMSPEQAAGDREIDARSDIYSLGAVTYEMLSGEPPHSGTSAQAIIAKLMTKDPAPLQSLRRTVPVNVACAVEKALAKLPADRFAKAQDFATALTNPSFTISGGATTGAYGPVHGSRNWKNATLGVAALALVLAAALGFLLTRPPADKPVLRYALGLDSTEAFNGAYGRVDVSRDGSYIVYTVPGNKLMLRRRDQLRGTLIPGVDADAYSPFFSWDGTKVGYVGPPALMKIVSLTGGPPVTVADSLVPPGAAWGPNGNLYSTGLNGHGIVRLTESPGTKPVHVTRVDSAQGEIQHIWPAPLPNGKGLLFTILYGKGKPSAIAALDLATGKYHVLVSGGRAAYSPNGQLLYTTLDGTLMTVAFDQDAMRLTGQPTAVSEGIRIGGLNASDFGATLDGTLFYTMGGAGIERELVWVGRDGKADVVDPSWKASFNYPALSPDGKQLAVSINAARGANTDVWVKQLDKGPALKLTFDGTSNVYPNWTPDGRSITYEGNPSNAEDLFTKRADGSAQAVLQLHFKRDVTTSRWSRDGKWLIFRTATTTVGGADIFAIRPGVDSQPIPVAATTFAEGGPALSPDGRWLAYASNETGRFEIFVVPFPNVAAAKWPVSVQGGSEPLWSHSGRELFYRDAAGNLNSVAIKPGPTFSMGATTTLFSAREYLASVTHTDYDISPDDKRFIFVRPLGGTSQDKLVFVENWFEELKKTK